MATDFLVYWMTRPSGLALMGLALIIPFVLWRLVLGKAFAVVGFGPLGVGYLCAAAGFFAITFIFAYMEFSARVSSGLLREDQRWSIVPGWTLYIGLISLIFVLPLMALGAPYAALLLRLRQLTYASMTASAAGLWLALGLLIWAIPLNEWHRTHRLQSFIWWLREILPGVVLIAVPFLLGIYATSGRARRGEA
jgi:hypothetical protein